MKKVFTVVLLVLLASACHKESDRDGGPCLTCPPPYTQSILLDTLSIEPTAVVFQVSTRDSTHLGVVQLYRDSVSVFSKMILNIDTTIIDTALLPAHHYRYKAYRLTGTARTDSSSPLVITTMDTTSHDFTWDVDTLGDGNSSVLFDVAIINDTLAFAVGELYLRDSTGQFDQLPHNVAIWNGRRWLLQKLNYEGGPPTIGSIIALSDDDVWLDPWFHWDGQSFSEVPVDPVFIGRRVAKMWGRSGDLFAVGDSGFIAHFDGHSWQRMESGTDMGLLDVYGSPDGSTVWTCGYSETGRGTSLFQNTGGVWQLAYDGTGLEFQIRHGSLSGAYASVYSPGKSKLFVASDAGVYETNTKMLPLALRLSFTASFFPGFPFSLRGSGSNDFTLVGEYYMIAHFNGSSWRQFGSFMGQNGHLNAVAQRGGFIVAVGYSYDPINSRAMVVRGRR